MAENLTQEQKAVLNDLLDAFHVTDSMIKGEDPLQIIDPVNQNYKKVVKNHLNLVDFNAETAQSSIVNYDKLKSAIEKIAEKIGQDGEVPQAFQTPEFQKHMKNIGDFVGKAYSEETQESISQMIEHVAKKQAKEKAGLVNKRGESVAQEFKVILKKIRNFFRNLINNDKGTKIQAQEIAENITKHFSLKSEDTKTVIPNARQNINQHEHNK